MLKQTQTVLQKRQQQIQFFFEHFSTQLNNISFFRKNLTNDINIAFGQLLFKNESFYNFNFLMLNRFKIVTFFL